MRFIKFSALLMLIFITSIARSQQLNFQGVARNSSGAVLTSQTIKVRLSIRDALPSGTVQYSETRSVTTSAYGSFKVLIGSPGALALTGTMSAVTWSSGPKFLQVEVDPSNGNTFTDIGTTEMVTVPTAVYATTAGNVPDNSITTAKLQNESVTTTKLAAGVIPSSLPPSGAAGGDLSGSYPNPSVSKISGVNVSSTAPASGQVLKYDGTSWTPGTDSTVTSYWTLNGNSIYNNNNSGAGYVGIGTPTPTARLHVLGRGGVLFSGEAANELTPFLPPASGTGTRLMWYPEKAAFRVGSVVGLKWDKDSIGIYSFASGRNTKAGGENSTSMGFQTTADGNTSTSMGNKTIASGKYSTSLGSESTASGFSSTSMGDRTNATGNYSTSMGLLNTASGQTSTSMGQENISSGSYSTSMGYNTTASGYGSTSMGVYTEAAGYNATSMGYATSANPYMSVAIGRFNDTIAGSSASTWVSTDPLFMIGNGSLTNSNNAMTVYKNGNTDIQGFTQLGTGAPAIKMKLVTFNSSSVDGGFRSFSLGVPSGSIIGMQVMLNWTAENWLGSGYTRVAGYEFQYILVDSTITVYNISGNSANILSKPIRVLVTYTE